jgi:putative permease
MNVISAWFKRYLSDPQVVILAVLLTLGFATILLLGHTLAPVIASMVIAYLLEGVAAFLQRYHMPRLLAVLIVFSGFFAALVYSLFGLLPLLSGQMTQFFQELPNMVARGQQLLLQLPQAYPGYVSQEIVQDLIAAVRTEVGSWGQHVLSHSLAYIPDLITLLVYLILVPTLVFFFLKDKEEMFRWVTSFLPRERSLSMRVWHEMNEQIGNYVRGKFLEVFITGLASVAVFRFMGLNYAMLLGALVGVSAIVPYIGVTAVTIPVAMVAFFQWGWSSDFAYVMLAYTVIQVVDGNVLAPLIFSEAVSLHPVAIIAALLVFGDLWGFWGIFFAIPLATLISTVISAWPRATHDAPLLMPPERGTHPN